MHVVLRVQSESRMPMLGVVPAKEIRAVRSCVFEGAEALRKIRPVLERLELGLRVRIIVRDVRPRVRLRHTEIGEE